MMTTVHIEKAWYLCRKRRRSDRIFCTIFIFSIPASRVSSNASMTTGLWACHSIAMSKCIKQQQQKLACITKTTTSQHNIYFFPSLVHRKVGALFLVVMALRWSPCTKKSFKKEKMVRSHILICTKHIYLFNHPHRSLSSTATMTTGVLSMSISIANPGASNRS